MGLPVLTEINPEAMAGVSSMSSATFYQSQQKGTRTEATSSATFYQSQQKRPMTSATFFYQSQQKPTRTESSPTRRQVRKPKRARSAPADYRHPDRSPRYRPRGADQLLRHNSRRMMYY